MTTSEETKPIQITRVTPEPTTSSEKAEGDQKDARPKEIGGRNGLDPTRFGEWEKNGRCIDF